MIKTFSQKPTQIPECMRRAPFAQTENRERREHKKYKNSVESELNALRVKCKGPAPIGVSTNAKNSGETFDLEEMVETRRIELPTFALRTRRSPS